MTDSNWEYPRVPVLKTERLLLRAHRPEDFEDCAALWGDPEVVRYIGGRPQSREEVWNRLLRYTGQWAWVGYGMWVVEEKASGRFVGEVGYANHKRDIQPPLAGLPELGWVLATAFHGKGYGLESVRAAMAWGAKHLESSRSVCIIQPEHVRSIRLAERCGFRQWQIGSYRGEPILIFTHEANSGG